VSTERRARRILSKQMGDLVAADLRPLVGKTIEVHVVDGPKHIRNYDDTYLGVLEGYHLSGPTARRTSAGDGTLSLSTFRVDANRYQIITIDEITGA
jgi:hypothetical protein